MSEALERRGVQRFSFQCRSAARGTAPASPHAAPSPGLGAGDLAGGSGLAPAGVGAATEDEEALATASIGAPAAMERLLRQAAASELDERELERAVESLSQCESRAAASLHNAVDELKAAFRGRLERLEAAFVAQADRIRDELTAAVYTERRERAGEVAARAEELCAAMARRDGSSRRLAAAADRGSGRGDRARRDWRELPVPRAAQQRVNPSTAAPRDLPAAARLDLGDEREWWGSEEEE